MPGDDDDETRMPTETAVDALPASAREIPIRESLGDRQADAERVRDLAIGNEPGSLETLRYGALPAVDVNATIVSQRASDAAALLRDRAIASFAGPRSGGEGDAESIEMTLDRDALVTLAREGGEPRAIDVNATIVSKSAASAAEQERDVAFEALREGTEEDLRATIQRPRRPSDVPRPRHPSDAPRRTFDENGPPKLRSEPDVRGLRARSDDDTGVTTQVRGNEMRGTINRRAPSDAEPQLDADDQAVIARLRALPPEGREPDWKTLESAIRAETRELPMYRPWWQRWQYLVPLGALAATAAFALVVVGVASKPSPQRTSLLTAPRDAGTSESVEAPAHEPAPALWLDGEPFDLDEVEPAALDEMLPDPAVEADAASDGSTDTDGGDDDGILPVVDYGWLDTLNDAAVARAENWLARKRS